MANFHAINFRRTRIYSFLRTNNNALDASEFVYKTKTAIDFLSDVMLL